MAYPDPFASQPKTGTPQQDADVDTAAAVVHRARRDKYVPYQDSPHYDGEHGSQESYYGNYDDRWGRQPYDYCSTTETIRRRKYGSSSDDPRSWERIERRYQHHDKNRRRDEERGRRDHTGQDEGERHAARAHDRENEERVTGYERQHDEDRHGDYEAHHDDRHKEHEYDESTHRRPRGRRRSRSTSEKRHRSRSDRSTSNPPPYRPPKVAPKYDPSRPPEKYTLLKAAKSAAMAGGVEAVRCRYEPGPWNGQKAQRVALAAAVGVVIGSLRNGRNQDSGKRPYAEAAMTGFYAIDFLKRVARHTEFDKGAKDEQRNWREEAKRKARDSRKRIPDEEWSNREDNESDREKRRSYQEGRRMDREDRIADPGESGKEARQKGSGGRGQY